MNRPGRFDGLIFVPPPDAAREQILALHLRRARGKNSTSSTAKRRRSAAAVERAVDQALEGGGEHPSPRNTSTLCSRASVPSTLEWLATARNYVDFADQGGTTRSRATSRAWKD